MHANLRDLLHARPRAAEIWGVRHIILQSDDVPVLPVVMDRRRQPDRRAAWRGGRRDSDWHRRPPGVWPRVALERPPSPGWRRLLASFQLW
jgi:hypothetical protein